MAKRANGTTKIEKLRTFLKRPPKGWESMSRKDKVAQAAKASGMTPGSVGVAASTQPDVRRAFGLPEAAPRARGGRASAGRRVRSGIPRQPGTVMAAKNAIGSLGLEDLIEVSQFLRRTLAKRAEAANRELKAYR